MQTNARVSIALLVAGACVACLAQAQAAEPCPQPRFTGNAPEPYYSLKNPLPADRDLRAAEALFKGEVRGQFGCAACHGPTGAGDGKLSSQFNPHPRNFTCAQTINGVPDGQLFWIIRYGSPGASMPAHKNLSDEQIWELVSHIRRLAR
jgi:mono/diheme cytochrome c family protein